MLSQSNPTLISIIIPVYNAEKFLTEALDSISRQGIRDLQIIAVDDGSDDNSLKILQNSQLNIEVIKHTKQTGPAASRNAGLSCLRGEFVAFLDADDYWSDTHLLQTINFFQNDSNLMIVKGLTCPFSEKENGEKILRESVYFPFLLGSSLYRREVFNIVGNFSEDLLQASDADFHVRCLHAKMKIAESNLLSLYYRRHDSNLTRDTAAALKARIAFIKKKIDREKS